MHFTITFIPWLNPIAVSFLYEEPPSLRSTPWGAYKTRAAISWFLSLHSELTLNVHIPSMAIIYQALIFRDGRPSQSAGSGAQTCHLSHRSETPCWLSYWACSTLPVQCMVFAFTLDLYSIVKSFKPLLFRSISDCWHVGTLNSWSEAVLVHHFQYWCSSESKCVVISSVHCNQTNNKKQGS